MEARTIATRPTREQVEDFLFQEADLIDEGKLNEWLALFAKDAIYWVPCNKDDLDPSREVSIIYDNIDHLEDRVWRLKSGLPHSADPFPRTRHLITNVRVGQLDGDLLSIRSGFILTEVRRGIQKIYTGWYDHQLRLSNGEFLIAFKKVILLNNNDYIDNLSFIL